MMQKEKSVVISLWSAGSCGRKQLAGILRYINAGHRWNVRIIMDPKDLTASTVAEASKNGTDGFIAFVPPETEAAAAVSQVPAVILSFPSPALRKRKRNVVFFLNDNERIGHEGADYLLSLGRFASYAFVPDLAGRGWSCEREEAFCRRLAEKGISVRLPPSQPRGRTTPLDLSAWLQSLPKPIAVMAPFDFRARDVADACKQSGLSVPKDVAIIGVDDDELICEATHPFLTSIGIDQEVIGYRAAETLNRLMSAKRPQLAETVCLPCGKIVERESTRAIAPSVLIVKRIQSVVDEHFREGITADDVAARLGISRRLADLRFSEATGRTVREALEMRRLNEIMRRLKTSDLPVAKITRLCGLQNDLWIKYVFKRRTGMTMTEWRKRNRKRR